LRRLALALLGLIVLFSLTLPCGCCPSPARGVSGVEITAPQIVSEKEELVEAKYSPLGEVVSKVVKVSFEVRNNGTEPVTVSIIDRVRRINASTLSMLYGTPPPTRLEKFGDFTLIIWENVTIQSGESVRYQYMADTWRSLPVEVEGRVLVNGEPRSLRRVGEIYAVDANLSDTITFELLLKNRLQRLYTGRSLATPMVSCSVSITLPEEYFTGLRAEPETEYTVIANRYLVNWLAFLNESARTFRVSARVRKVSAWGEVPIEAFSVQVMPAASMLRRELERSLQEINASIATLQGFTNSSYELSNALSRMGGCVEGMAESLGDLEEAGAGLMESVNAMAQAIYAQYAVTEQVRILLRGALTSLNRFLNDSRTQAFLATPLNLDLAQCLNQTATQLAASITLIETIQRGDPTQNLPGLLQLYNLTLQISQALNSTSTATGEIRQHLLKLGESLTSMSNATREAGDETAEALKELVEKRAELEDAIVILGFQGLQPPPLEVRGRSTPTSYGLDVRLELVDGVWAITGVNLTNPGALTLFVYGVAVQVEGQNGPIRPSRVDAYVNGSWVEFSLENVTQLGLRYDSERGVLYLQPWAEVNATSSLGVLIDWLGNPIRVMVGGGLKPDVKCEVDVGWVPENVEVKPARGEIVYSITQPHILVKNVTWTPAPRPPSEEEGRGWLEEFMEYLLSSIKELAKHLQTPEAQPLIATALVSIVIGFIIGMIGGASMAARRRGAQGEPVEKAGGRGEVTTDDLLREINRLEGILRGEEPKAE